MHCTCCVFCNKKTILIRHELFELYGIVIQPKTGKFPRGSRRGLTFSINIHFEKSSELSTKLENGSKVSSFRQHRNT